jgi:hypothetical protein
MTGRRALRRLESGFLHNQVEGGIGCRNDITKFLGAVVGPIEIFPGPNLSFQLGILLLQLGVLLMQSGYALAGCLCLAGLVQREEG